MLHLPDLSQQHYQLLNISNSRFLVFTSVEENQNYSDDDKMLRFRSNGCWPENSDKTVAWGNLFDDPFTANCL